MRRIDLKKWPRRRLFELFRSMQFPHFSLTSELDVTRLLAFAKQRELRSYRLALYLVCRAANETPALRLRLENRELIEHESVGIAPTVLGKETLNFVVAPYHKSPARFLAVFGRREAAVRRRKTLNLEGDEQTGTACIYVSCLPWRNFTSITNPLACAEDSIPRITWSAYTPRADRTVMSVSLQCHHALVDGLDVEHFLERLQSLADSPDKVFRTLPPAKKR
jgi:chloramphenicol O-acetyltransferase